ncbi:MAG: rod shape-determining protein MreC [Succiniclasticum sp.]|jgi:rod shape-determining protein MreC
MMKKKQFVIVLAVLALVACMVLAVNQRWRFPLVNQAVSTVLLPVNSAALFVHDKVAGFWEAQRLNSTLKEENAQLKSRLGQLDSAEYRIARLEAENDQLRAMVGYKQKNPEETLLPARVVGVSLGDLREYFFLDKGTADGVRQDMLVTTSAGLAGIVEDAYTHYSRVQYLSSSSSRIGVKVQRFGSNAVGVLAGHGPASARLRMMYIARDADIREGDLIVTNGLGGKYPSGVYIGKVASVTPDPIGLQKVAEVDPAADLRVLDKVFVVLHVDEAALLAREVRQQEQAAASRKAEEQKKQPAAPAAAAK